MWGSHPDYSVSHSSNPCWTQSVLRTPKFHGDCLGGTSPWRSTRRASAPALPPAWPGPLQGEILGASGRLERKVGAAAVLPGGTHLCMLLCAFYAPPSSFICGRLAPFAGQEGTPGPGSLWMDQGLGRPCTELCGFFLGCVLLQFALLLTALIYF